MAIFKATAITADQLLLNRLPGRSAGRVHSVFSRVININGSGTLYSLGLETVDDGPGMIRVALSDPCRRMDMLGVETGVCVTIQGTDICLGRNLRIDYSKAQEWNRPLPDFPRVVPETLIALRKLLILLGQAGGFRDFYSANASETSDLVVRELSSRGQRLLKSLTEKNMEDATAAAHSLLGLGGGLTPSGDDFLAALITIFFMPNGPFGSSFQLFGDHVAASAVSRTTAISASMLKIAASGRARGGVLDFLGMISVKDQQELPAYTVKVLEFGSLSGTDWLAGLIAGLELGRYLQEFAE